MRPVLLAVVVAETIYRYEGLESDVVFVVLDDVSTDRERRSLISERVVRMLPSA